MVLKEMPLVTIHLSGFIRGHALAGCFDMHDWPPFLKSSHSTYISMTFTFIAILMKVVCNVIYQANQRIQNRSASNKTVKVYYVISVVSWRHNNYAIRGFAY